MRKEHLTTAPQPFFYRHMTPQYFLVMLSLEKALFLVSNGRSVK